MAYITLSLTILIQIFVENVFIWSLAIVNEYQTDEEKYTQTVVMALD